MDVPNDGSGWFARCVRHTTASDLPGDKRNHCRRRDQDHLRQQGYRNARAAENSTWRPAGECSLQGQTGVALRAAPQAIYGEASRGARCRIRIARYQNRRFGRPIKRTLLAPPAPWLATLFCCVAALTIPQRSIISGAPILGVSSLQLTRASAGLFCPRKGGPDACSAGPGLKDQASRVRRRCRQLLGASAAFDRRPRAGDLRGLAWRFAFGGAL